jgi:hypothetical protein
MVATVYGPERVNELGLEYIGRRYAEAGDERIPNDEWRWPEYNGLLPCDRIGVERNEETPLGRIGA